MKEKKSYLFICLFDGLHFQGGGRKEMLKLSVVNTGMAVIDVRNGSFARPIVSCLRLIVGLFRGYDDCALSKQDLIGIFEDVLWAEFGHWNARFSALVVDVILKVHF